MESDLNVDDPSRHENDQRAETWFFKIIVRLDDCKDFSDILIACNLKKLQAADGAQPFNCLCNFMGCMPGIRV